jgi:hypothetical protein
MTKHHFPEHVILRSFLANLSEELRHLAASALEIEDRVGDVIAEGLAGGEKLSLSLQGLDHLVQTANELSVFIAALSNSADDNIAIPVSGHIRAIGLRSLAEALVGQAGPRSERLNGRGEVDLF